ncbi:NAD(P)/FAD-dependent oxidoreductase [Dokdonella sp.]|uniref:NAD(P)/FAD-dependent oxidoreductase n=1 Tax=Dokdonella sp. TaxID=2291710 RepID=UPI002F3ED2F5
MRIAVVGSGISGLASAWLLSREHDVVLYEADTRLGGHTHTHDVGVGGRHYRVDTGFIVHNRANYPLLTQLFAELGVATQPTTMSFSVRNERSGLEYNPASFDTLFCQRRNLVSPRFLGMLRDLVRFYRLAPQLLADEAEGPTLEEFLRRHRFGSAFRDDHILPMTSALWSAPAAHALAFPARHLAEFMANHAMFELSNRPEWRVVCGGSRSYIDAMSARWRVSVRTGAPVQGVRRHDAGVELRLHGERQHHDALVLACHSDQALGLLDDASERERDILDSIRYQPNDVVLHTDARLLPRNRKAWAAWNAQVRPEERAPCTVSYCMNLLQRIDAPMPLVVSLNRAAEIDPARVLRRMRYHHPVFTHAAVAAQRRKAEIQGQRRTWFAGAYWGWGFHEDGMRSAVEVADALGVRWGVGSRAAANAPAAFAHAGSVPT